MMICHFLRNEIICHLYIHFVIYYFWFQWIRNKDCEVLGYFHFQFYVMLNTKFEHVVGNHTEFYIFLHKNCSNLLPPAHMHASPECWIPGMDQLSRLAPNVCHSYQDATGQPFAARMFSVMHLCKIKWSRFRYQEYVETRWSFPPQPVTVSRVWLFNSVHTVRSAEEETELAV
jgi:hypothetical protein